MECPPNGRDGTQTAGMFRVGTTAVVLLSALMLPHSSSTASLSFCYGSLRAAFGTYFLVGRTMVVVDSRQTADHGPVLLSFQHYKLLSVVLGRGPICTQNSAAHTRGRLMPYTQSWSLTH